MIPKNGRNTINMAKTGNMPMNMRLKSRLMEISRMEVDSILRSGLLQVTAMRRESFRISLNRCSVRGEEANDRQVMVSADRIIQPNYI